MGSGADEEVAVTNNHDALVRLDPGAGDDWIAVDTAPLPEGSGEYAGFSIDTLEDGSDTVTLNIDSLDHLRAFDLRMGAEDRLEINLGEEIGGELVAVTYDYEDPSGGHYTMVPRQLEIYHVPAGTDIAALSDAEANPVWQSLAPFGDPYMVQDSLAETYGATLIATVPLGYLEQSDGEDGVNPEPILEDARYEGPEVVGNRAVTAFTGFESGYGAGDEPGDEETAAPDEPFFAVSVDGAPVGEAALETGRYGALSYHGTDEDEDIVVNTSFDQSLTLSTGGGSNSVTVEFSDSPVYDPDGTSNRPPVISIHPEGEDDTVTLDIDAGAENWETRGPVLVDQLEGALEIDIDEDIPGILVAVPSGEGSAGSTFFAYNFLYDVYLVDEGATAEEITAALGASHDYSDNGFATWSTGKVGNVLGERGGVHLASLRLGSLDETNTNDPFEITSRVFDFVQPPRFESFGRPLMEISA